MEQELQNRVMKLARKYDQRMKEESGIPSSMQENDIKAYIEQVIKEVRQRKDQ